MPGVARYRITGGTLIEVALFPGAEPSLAEFLLMTTPFGALIHQRGELALHASAVLSPISGRALLIAGVSGAGKSTAAAALAQCGWTVINDDVSRITLEGNEPVVWPGFQSLKLWRQSCELLHLDSETLMRTRGGKEKYFWPGEAAPQFQPVPIAAVVELLPSKEHAQDGRGVERPPEGLRNVSSPMVARSRALCASDEPPAGLERLTGREVLGAYFRLTFRQPMVEGLGCQLPHFRHASRLAASVPTYRFSGCRQIGPRALAEQLESLVMEPAPT